MQYDSNGNLAVATDARGVVSSYLYDANDRLTSISYPSSGENITFTYDRYPTSGTLECTHGIGRLCRVTDAAGETVFDYFPDGMLKAEKRSEGGQVYVTSYEYDAANRLVATTTPTGRTLSVDLDEVGRASALRLGTGGGQMFLTSQASFNALNQLTGRRTGNGLWEWRSYDGEDRLAGINVNVDSDGDGIADGWESVHGLNPTYAGDGGEDPDGDGLTNLAEYIAGSDPNNRDSDGDGMPDGADPDPSTASFGWLIPILRVLTN